MHMLKQREPKGGTLWWGWIKRILEEREEKLRMRRWPPSGNLTVVLERITQLAAVLLLKV